MHYVTKVKNNNQKLINYLNNNKINSFIFILLFFFFHILYINTPFVNFEWAYRMGTQAILTSSQSLLKLYFNNQANPIVYSFLSSLPVFLFGDHYASYRVFSLVGGTLLLIMLLRHRMPYLIMIVGLNPLIWIYSGRAYSEIISVGIMMMALGTSQNGVVKGILGAFSAIIKYHSIMVSGSYWGIRWLGNLFKCKSKAWYDKNLLAGAVSIAGLFTFLLVYYQELGIWIMPDQYKTTFSINFLNAINNFYSYGFYLAGMFFLTIPFLLQNTTWGGQILAISISLPLALLNQNLGEMDFGSFNYVFSSKFIFFIKWIGFWNFLICVLHFWKYDESRIILLTILFYILILSLTRPAQRYLIFVIPFWAILICKYIDLGEIFKWSYICILIGVNIFAIVYQINTATAAEKIVFWAQTNNIAIKSNAIYPHTGLFSHHNSHSEIYVSLSYNPENELLTKQTVSILGYPIKTYHVLRKQ